MPHHDARRFPICCLRHHSCSSSRGFLFAQQMVCYDYFLPKVYSERQFNPSLLLHFNLIELICRKYRHLVLLCYSLTEQSGGLAPCVVIALFCCTSRLRQSTLRSCLRVKRTCSLPCFATCQALPNHPQFKPAFFFKSFGLLGNTTPRTYVDIRKSPVIIMDKAERRSVKRRNRKLRKAGPEATIAQQQRSFQRAGQDEQAARLEKTAKLQ